MNATTSSTTVPREVLYIISNLHDCKEYDRLVAHWHRDRHALSFVLLNPVMECGMQRNIRAAGFPCETILYRGRRDAPAALRALIALIRRRRPAIVHTNLLDAAMIGLLAARITGVPATVNTRHHTTHNHKYHPIKGVAYDRVINRLATATIAISGVSREVLVDREGVSAERVHLLPHGFDLTDRSAPDPVLLATLRQRYALEGPHGPVIGIIARPFAWKGLDHALPAIGMLLREHPDARVLLFNWKHTPDRERYEAMLGEWPAGTWRTVEYEADVEAMYALLDLFIHVPEDRDSEAFGLVYIEALLSGTPSVFTVSGILNDLPTDQLRDVVLVPFGDATAIARAAGDLLRERRTPEQRARTARHHIACIGPVIDIERRMDRLHDLYDALLAGHLAR